MAIMLDAGMPILRSLDTLIEGRAGPLKRTLSEIRESLTKGSSLAEAMDKHRKVSPEMDRMLIEAGDNSGSLGDSFKMLSQWHEFVQSITWRGAVRYDLSHLQSPRRSAHRSGLPELRPGQNRRVAPTSARCSRSCCCSGHSSGYRGGALLIAPVDRVSGIAIPFDFLPLRIPILGTAIYHLSICRYAKAFGMLYKAGVPISEKATGMR